MLHLYHTAGSSNSQRVRLVLAEKDLPWESHLLKPGEQHTPEFRTISPPGTVPVLVDDGDALFDSVVINEYLDDAYPETPLRPDYSYEMATMRQWTKHADDYLQKSIAVFTHVLVRRPAMLEEFDGDVDAAIAQIDDPIILGWRRSVYVEGLESPHATQAMSLIQASLTKMEIALEGHGWLVGGNFSLAEIALIPAIYRLECLGMDFLWAPHHTSVIAWIQRCKARASFQKAVISCLTPKMLQEYQMAGFRVRSDVRRLAELVAVSN